jgi:tyrosyl-tRNA synthetase
MVTNPIIIGTDGRKMSKSYGNTININEEPFDMYGKAMRISDEHIPEYLELSSSFSGSEIDRLCRELKSGGKEMEIKKRLAENLVEQYQGAEAARLAAEKFRQVVQQKAAPDEVPEVSVPSELVGASWIDLCAGLKLTKSKGEMRRLMQQGGFRVEQEQVTDQEARASIPSNGVLIRLGKRRYYRLVR